MKKAQTTLFVNVIFGVLFIIAIFFAYLFINHEFKNLKDLEMIEFQEIDSASAYVSTLEEADEESVKNLLKINKQIVDNIVEGKTSDERQKSRIKYYKSFRDEVGSESSNNIKPEHWMIKYYPVIYNNQIGLFIPSVLFYAKGKSPEDINCIAFNVGTGNPWEPSLNPSLQVSNHYDEYCKLMELKK